MVGFATNAQWFVNHKAGMKTGTAMLVPTAGGDLDLSYANLKWVTNMPSELKYPEKFSCRKTKKMNNTDLVFF